MAGAARLLIVVGALAGAMVSVGGAILFARYATPVLLAGSRNAGFAMAAFLLVLGAAVRRKMAAKRRVAAVR